MNHGKCKLWHSLCKRRSKHNKIQILLLSFLLITTMAAAGTLAYLSARTTDLKNTFKPTHVTCQVTEQFDGTTKSSVNVTNTGDIEAYIRVKLVSYRVNQEGQHIGGAAEVPDFAPGTNWVKNGAFYYYTLPVNPGEQPADDLIDQITLSGSYQDADGGKQVIEVMAEAIQSGPVEAVGSSWGVTIAPGSVTAYQG